MKRSLFAIRNYIIFFMLVAFVVTCCFLLFFAFLQHNVPEIFTEENIRNAAAATFVNVLLLSALCTVIDAIRRKITIEKPVMRILEATEKITEGDFQVCIEPVHNLSGTNELDMIIRHLNRMAKELSGIETLRTDFISNVSHELKTPLAVIQNYAIMLQAPDISEEQRITYAASITSATKRLTSLITNILKLNKLENQQIFPECQRYNVSEQLCACILEFENIWEEKEIQIDTNIEEDVYLHTDKELLSLVWNNLLSNALKFTEHGGQIGIELHSQNDHVVISISDTGCGMSKETGRRIFEKFYQGDASHATQGNGLGLALVKRVIDITGGTIDVISELGKGSTFTVKIPQEALHEKVAKDTA